MPQIDTYKQTYTVLGKDVDVKWASYDFEPDVAGLGEPMREILLDSGVMYSKTEEPTIKVSHLLNDEMQGFSALHEELCQGLQLVNCNIVEKIVLDVISDTQQRAEYIDMRYRMFGALCLIDANNEQFEATKRLLA